MERLTYVAEDGEVLFHPEDLPEDEGMTVRDTPMEKRTYKEKMMNDKLTPDITPQLALLAFAVLQQYCNSISPHDCITCAFYNVCPECFMGCPGDQGDTIRKLQSNE